MTFRFSRAARECIHETGIDPEDDVHALRTGLHTPTSLLEHRLDSADEEREPGWHDYVSAVVSEAYAPLSLAR